MRDKKPFGSDDAPKGFLHLYFGGAACIILLSIKFIAIVRRKL